MKQLGTASVFLLSVFGLCTAACGSSSQPPAPPPAAPQASQVPPSDVVSKPAEASSAAPVTPAPEEHAKQPPHWHYEGAEGPAKWGELAAEWEKCKTGTEQSPVDLPKAGEPHGKTPLAVNYHALPLEILNNGHTVQVAGISGGKLTLDGKDFELQQFHLHAPSEHTVASVVYDGELHLVHKSASGELAVIGILLKKGKENKTLAPVFAAAPKEEGHDAKPVAGAQIELAKLVPAKASYYTYSGSLTTPPCSEGVHWFVLKQPVEVSEAQLQKFKDVIHGGNARPVMPLGARKVLEVRP
ncbi:MAG: carbonic anhydrase family protein [Polyangiaceae bacterium]